MESNEGESIMKYTWEGKDIIPGRHVLAHNKSEEYIIIYDPSICEFKYGLVSLNDGMVVSSKTGKHTLANYFNDSGILPRTIE
jgi:hypothetical protein